VKLMRIAAAGALVLLASASTVAAPERPWSSDRAIFTAEAAQKKWVRFRGSTTFWTPSLADALALEKGLPEYIRRHLSRDDRLASDKKEPLWERAKTYKRQYIGVRLKGRRIVYANFFCNAFTTDWRNERVDVDDGGDCYFQVEYEVDKATFANLMVNGGA
jgi:hypothetical protein